MNIDLGAYLLESQRMTYLTLWYNKIMGFSKIQGDFCSVLYFNIASYAFLP